MSRCCCGPRWPRRSRGQGLRVSDLDGADRLVAPSAVRLATDPAAAFAEADIVLVTVKSGDTAAMAELIAEHGASGATVVSLQNGVGNVDVLLARLGGMARVVAGMVPFNVVQTRAAGRAAALPSRDQRDRPDRRRRGRVARGARREGRGGGREPRTWPACCGASCCSTSTMR